MIPPRAIWRLLVLPAYMLLAGVVFALALRNTAGSILSPLAALAPWVLVVAALLALVTIFGGVLRWRRRLAAIRRGRAAHSQRADWSADAAQGVAPGGRG